jgi:hypothetical protein
MTGPPYLPGVHGNSTSQHERYLNLMCEPTCLWSTRVARPSAQCRAGKVNGLCPEPSLNLLRRGYRFVSPGS